MERGFFVHASDASPEMVRRTRARGVPADVCRWEDLPATRDFDTVFCIGNSLAHARDRRAALRGMAGALRPGGTLVLTTRNWEREQPSESYEAERGGRRARVTYAWSGSAVEITVRVGDQTVAERLEFFPFTHEELRADLRAAGFEPIESTFAPDVDRYLVSART
jgi:SAM-dependent methyltransferase